MSDPLSAKAVQVRDAIVSHYRENIETKPNYAAANADDLAKRLGWSTATVRKYLAEIQGGGRRWNYAEHGVECHDSGRTRYYTPTKRHLCRMIMRAMTDTDLARRAAVDVAARVTNPWIPQ